MTDKKITQIADFLYSSGDSRVVPFRLSLISGMHGQDLDRDQFVKLMKFLRDEVPTSESFHLFLDEVMD